MTKSTSQARIKPEIFVTLRPEPGPTYNSATVSMLTFRYAQHSYEKTIFGLPSSDAAASLSLLSPSVP